MNICHSISEFSPKDILRILEKYKNHNEIKTFVNRHRYDYNKLFVEKDEVILKNISSMI